jgi:hypothetical protein
MYTDKKENKIFLIYKEIQNGAVTRSFLRKCFRIYEEMRIYLTIFKEAVRRNCSILNFLVYEEIFIFFFISVRVHYSIYGMEFMQFQKSGMCQLSSLSLLLSVKDK